MSAQYSSYFFSGLLQAGNRPPSPTTPTGPAHGQTPSLSISVPPPSPTRVRSSSGSSTGTGQQPRLRKRKSSMSISVASPVSNLKSPIRSAGVAFQRQLLMSPTRARSGSVNDAQEIAEESKVASFVGRLRSGSLRFPRRLGGFTRRPGQAAPAPTAALPPLPLFPGIHAAPSAPLPLPPTSAPSLQSAFELDHDHTPGPRRPFAQRSHTTDNSQSFRMAIDELDVPMSPMTHLTPGFAKMGMPSRMRTPPPCPSSPPLPSSPMPMADSPIRR